MGKTNKTVRHSKRKVLRVRPVPGVIVQNLRLVNDVRDGASALDFDIARATTEAQTGDPATAVLNEFTRLTTAWGRLAKAFVFSDQNPAGVGERYNQMCASRDFLASLAAQNRSFRELHHKNGRERVERVYDLPDSVKREIISGLRMDNKSKAIRPVYPEPIETFLTKAELDRIGQCLYQGCTKFFWAGRLDKPCCSKRCDNAYRQHKFRNRHQERAPRNA